MNAIEIKNLTKVYGKNRGIQDINISVKEGEIYGFIGPNGAGKSTTIKTLLNFIYSTSGEALIFGMDSVKESEKIKEYIDNNLCDKETNTYYRNTEDKKEAINKR